MVLLFSFIVLGLMVYGFREYIISLKAISTGSNISDAKWEEVNEKEEKAEDKQSPKTDLDLEALGSLNELHLTTDPVAVEDSEDIFNGIDAINRIQVIYDEVNSGSSKTISDYLVEPVPSTKKVYSLQRLHEIDQDLGNANRSWLVNKNTSVKLSDILRFTICIPSAENDTIYKNNQVINSIKFDFMQAKNMDLASKSILLFQLVSLGYKPNIMFKDVYFLTSFNELIELVTDTGILFDLIMCVTSNSLRELVVDMILNYCWDHWNNQGKTNVLNIQSRITIFRVMCNLKIGLSVVELLSHQCKYRFELKLQTILREISRGLKCNDYLEIIPLIAQAIDISETVVMKYLFFDLLFVIIKCHGKCCMLDYIQDDKTDLKAIVQNGFWFKNNIKVINKANDIFEYLLTINPQITKWHQEIQGGNIYISSGKNTTEVKKSSEVDSIGVTPGGWKMVYH